MKTFIDRDGREWPLVTEGESNPAPGQLGAVLARRLGCANCVFWDGGGPPAAPVGRCRRHAPALASYSRQLEIPAGEETDPSGHQWGVFPLTDEDDWCGEFQAAPRNREDTP